MVRVCIIGASGYSGAELVSLLLAHGGVEIVGLYGSAKREAGGKPQQYAESFPRFRGQLDLPVRATNLDEIIALKPDAVFLATPHEASIELAPKLVAAGKDPALYPAFYGFQHADPGLLDKAVYGLPELFREQVKKAMLVAVPGCYPTSAILPLAPLARAGALAKSIGGLDVRPIIDSTSGVSGAGRSPSQRTLFCEVSQQPYNVLKHRHNPEIDAYAGTKVVFTPHLGPYDRGILSTIHVHLAEGWNGQRVGELYARTYAGERFVRLCQPGVWPAVNDVVYTNFCDIAFACDEPNRHLIIASAIDNLVKGAAGQAVQCMNIRLGLAEHLGVAAGVGQ